LDIFTMYSIGSSIFRPGDSNGDSWAARGRTRRGRYGWTVGPGPADRDYTGDDHPDGEHPQSTGEHAEHEQPGHEHAEHEPPGQRSDPTPDDNDDSVLGAQARRRAEVAAELPAEVEFPAEEDYAAGPGPNGRVESWRRRSAVGALLTGIALGLGEVLEAERKEPAIIQETSGVPPRDLPVEADLGEASPKRSVVHVRPWLLADPDASPRPSALPGSDESGPPTRVRAHPDPTSVPSPAHVEQTPTRHQAQKPATPVPARAPARRRFGRRH